MSIICTCGKASGPMCNGAIGCPLNATDGMPAPKLRKEATAISSPKQKARELIERFSKYCDHSIDKTIIDEYDKIHDKKKTFTQLAEFALKYHAKQSALVCIDEITEAIKVFHNGSDYVLQESQGWQYWQAVKEELLNHEQ